MPEQQIIPGVEPLLPRLRQAIYAGCAYNVPVDGFGDPKRLDTYLRIFANDAAHRAEETVKQWLSEAAAVEVTTK
jgi:hypothetical protein